MTALRISPVRRPHATTPDVCGATPTAVTSGRVLASPGRGAALMQGGAVRPAASTGSLSTKPTLCCLAEAQKSRLMKPMQLSQLRETRWSSPPLRPGRMPSSDQGVRPLRVGRDVNCVETGKLPQIRQPSADAPDGFSIRHIRAPTNPSPACRFATKEKRRKRKKGAKAPRLILTPPSHQHSN